MTPSDSPSFIPRRRSEPAAHQCAAAVCQTVAVPNHYIANPSCHTVDVVLGAPKWADYFINGEQQVIYNP